MQSDFDHHLFLEDIRKTAEATYAENPLDADNLTRWGGALLELSQFQSVPDSERMVRDAISKLEEALQVNSTKHDTLWCLGNAYICHAFSIPDQDEAKVYIEKATCHFEQAVAEDPGNEKYAKFLEVAAKVQEIQKEIYKEIHKSRLAQEVAAAGPSSSSGGTMSSKKKKTSGLKYDIFGWITLAVGIFTLVGFVKTLKPRRPRPL